MARFGCPTTRALRRGPGLAVACSGWLSRFPAMNGLRTDVDMRGVAVGAATPATLVRTSSLFAVAHESKDALVVRFVLQARVNAVHDSLSVRLL